MSQWSWKPLVSTTGGGGAIAARKERVQRYIEGQGDQEAKPVVDHLDGTLHDDNHGRASYSYDVSRGSSCDVHTMSQLRPTGLQPQLCVGAHPQPVSTASSLLDERASPQQTAGRSHFAQRTCDTYGSSFAHINEGAIPRASSSQGDNLNFLLSAAEATAAVEREQRKVKTLRSMPVPVQSVPPAPHLYAMSKDMRFSKIISPLNPLNQHRRTSTMGTSADGRSALGSAQPRAGVHGQDELNDPGRLMREMLQTAKDRDADLAAI